MTPEDLVEIELIKRLKYKYMRCLDQKLWDVVGECFAPDATASYSGGVYSFEGRDAIVEFLRSSMGATTMLTSHRCHHPEIDLDDDRAGADGTWAFEDTVILTEVGVTVQGAAFYRDRYVKDGGNWRIAHTGYRRTFEELVPRASIKGLKVTADWWETEGRSSLG